jgi:hypothetical protein
MRVKPKITKRAVELALARFAIGWEGHYWQKESNPAVAYELGQMCPSDEILEWLVNRVIYNYNKWPGFKEVRGTLCSHFEPLDGINAYCETGPDSAEAGEARYLEQHQQRKLLPSGTQDAQLNALLADVTEKKRIQ